LTDLDQAIRNTMKLIVLAIYIYNQTGTHMTLFEGPAMKLYFT
jgi:hypothetical protein